MQLDSAGGQGGEDVPTVGDLANKVSKMEDEVESLTVYVNTINTDVEKVNDSVFNMESILGSSKW